MYVFPKNWIYLIKLIFDFVKKIMAVFLTFLMLSAQVGFAVSTHFCGGEVSDRAFSLIARELNCGMDTMESSCSIDLNRSNSISETSCCDNESDVFQLRENLNKKQSTVKVELSFFKLFLATSVFLFENHEEVVVFHQLPPPPLIQQNTQVLFQNFLL